MLSATDQGTTLVVSSWAHVNDWKEYQDSPQRQLILNKLDSLLSEPATTEVWVESTVIG